MSFWEDCPGPHWSDWFWSVFSCSGLAFAQPIRRYPLDQPEKTSECSFFMAKPTDSKEIVDFLSKNFTITENAECALPEERLTRGIQSDWIVVIAKDKGVIVGTVISRALGSLSFQTVIQSQPKRSKFSSTDYIDFFCVAPDYRKTGVGSDLLKYIDYYSSERGRPIHFFQKELSPLYVIPPLWNGTYIYRETNQVGAVHQTTRIHISTSQKKRDMFQDLKITFLNPKSSLDSRYFVYDCGNFKVHAAITNTYHLYKNCPLGELLFYSVEETTEKIGEKAIASAIEDIIEFSGYRHILMDESVPHLKQMNWKRDASYFIYAYNVNPGKFFSVKPEFWF
jgi:hypothetical protein